MAITLDTSITGQETSGTTAQKTISFTVGNNSNRYLNIGVHAGGPFTTVNSVTYAGISATLISRKETANGTSNAFGWEVWGLVAPAVGTNNLTVTIDRSTQPFSFGANSWYGVDQTTPFSNSGSISANNSLGTLSISSNVGETINDFIATEAGLSNVAQTQIWNFTDGGQFIQQASSYKSATATTMSTYWSIAGGPADWAMISLSLKPSTGSFDYFFPLMMAGD